MLKRVLPLCGAILLLLLSIGIGYYFSFARSPRNCACPPPEIWELQLNQTFVKSSESIFSVKWIDISPKEFRFFFAFRSPHQGSLRVAASSYLASNPKGTTSLTTTVQVLGQLGAYTVGVVHVGRSSRAGQIIELQFTPPGESSPNWRLAPLKQLIEEPHQETSRYGLYPGASGLPEVDWSGPVMQQQVSYVRAIVPGQPVSSRSYVFVRMDDPVLVSVITKDEFFSIAGSSNFTP